MTHVHLKVCISIETQTFQPRGYTLPFFLSGYKTSSKQSCTTISGERPNKTCKFPFIFEGLTFNSCTLSWSNNNTKAWCSTKVDDSGYYKPGQWGFCESACQPTKLAEVGIDSSTISIVTISTTILILSSIIMIYYCYVKRKNGKEEKKTIPDHTVAIWTFPFHQNLVKKK